MKQIKRRNRHLTAASLQVVKQQISGTKSPSVLLGHEITGVGQQSALGIKRMKPSKTPLSGLGALLPLRGRKTTTRRLEFQLVSVNGG